jgi:hypothetical protein
MSAAQVLFNLLCYCVPNPDRAEVMAELVKLIEKHLHEQGEDWRL